MCDSKIQTFSFPRKTTLAPVCAPDVDNTSDVDEAEGPDCAKVEDSFEGCTPTKAKPFMLGCDDGPAKAGDADGADDADEACSAKPTCILPRGRSLADTVEAGRKALVQHIEQDLFAPDSDFPGACDEDLKEQMLHEAQSWTPEDNSVPFETFDPKEQAYETELCGRPFTVTFTDGWKTARALMTDPCGDAPAAEAC